MCESLLAACGKELWLDIRVKIHFIQCVRNLRTRKYDILPGGKVHKNVFIACALNYRVKNLALLANGGSLLYAIVNCEGVRNL